MYRDERYFEKPDEFLPERFLDSVHGTRSGVTDDAARNENLIFGGGRRICPGLALAKTTLVNALLFMMQIYCPNELQNTISPYILWAFEFRPVRDPRTGIEVPPKLEFKSVSSLL